MVKLKKMGSGEERHLSSSEITRLAYLHLGKSDSRMAVGCFLKAAERAKEEDAEVVVISSYLNAGACLVSEGQLKRGNTLLLSALKLTKMQKQEPDTTEARPPTMELSADIYYNLAVAAEKMDKFKKAAAYFKTSAECYLEVGCEAHAAESYSSLASCYGKLGESREQLSSLLSARQLHHKLGDPYNEAEACLELARTHLSQGQVDACKEMLSTVKLLCLRVNNHALQG